MMKIEVLYFAQLKEAMGKDRETVDVAAPGTVHEVVELLRRRPEWAMVSSLPLSFAVNEEIVHGNHELSDGDQLALLPPVSGG